MRWVGGWDFGAGGGGLYPIDCTSPSREEVARTSIAVVASLRAGIDTVHRDRIGSHCYLIYRYTLLEADRTRLQAHLPDTRISVYIVGARLLLRFSCRVSFGDVDTARTSNGRYIRNVSLCQCCASAVVEVLRRFKALACYSRGYIGTRRRRKRERFSPSRPRPPPPLTHPIAPPPFQ